MGEDGGDRDADVELLGCWARTEQVVDVYPAVRRGDKQGPPENGRAANRGGWEAAQQRGAWRMAFHGEQAHFSITKSNHHCHLSASVGIQRCKGTDTECCAHLASLTTSTSWTKAGTASQLTTPLSPRDGPTQQSKASLFPRIPGTTASMCR